MGAFSYVTARFRDITSWVLALALTMVMGSSLLGCTAAPGPGDSTGAPNDAGPAEAVDVDLGAADDAGFDVNPGTPGDAGFDAPFDPTFPAGTWYLAAEGARLELNIAQSASGYAGAIANEGARPDVLSNVTWDSIGSWLEFRRDRADSFEWYRMSIVDGIASGRFARSRMSSQPALTAYASHVTGWSPNFVDTDIVPRTWQIVLGGTRLGVLRIDGDGDGVLRGRLKVFDNSEPSAAREE